MKETLLIVYNSQLDADDEGEGAFYTFYRDGTYTYSKWKDHDFSDWRIIDSSFQIRHISPNRPNPKWENCNDGDELELIKLLTAEIEIEKLLTLG